MYGPDVIHSTLVHLMPKFEEMFLLGHPVLEELYNSGQVKKINLQGPWLEFNVVTNGPGTTTGLRSGTEMIASSRRPTMRRGNEHAYRSVYHFDIPGAEFAQTGGEQDYARIIDEYPKLAMADYKDQYARQFAAGTHSAGTDISGSVALNGHVTLNGLQTYNPDGTPRAGIFHPTAVQNATVHGLPMRDAAVNPVAGWGHQYADIASFGTDGLKTMRKVKQLAGQQGLSLEGSGINLMFADQDSYQNIVDNYDQQVIVNDKIDNPASAYSGRDSILFDKAKLYWEPAIDLSDTVAWTGDTQNGVLFGLNTKFWHFFFLANHADKATNGNFAIQKPILSPTQDVWQYRIISHFNTYCSSLRHQMMLTGTATA